MNDTSLISSKGVRVLIEAIHRALYKKCLHWQMLHGGQLGVGKLVIRVVWDHETAGSSPAT
jgi:hypothetical protein